MSAPPHTATMTREQLLMWAEAYYKRVKRWTTARWRVEGASIGNSRIMTQSAARKTAKRYGGTVVCVIPSREDYAGHCRGMGRKAIEL